MTFSRGSKFFCQGSVYSREVGSLAILCLLCYEAGLPYDIHYNDAIMGAMASQITSLAIVYSNIYSGADQRKHQSPASLALVRGIHQWTWPVMRKMFPFDDVIMSKAVYERNHIISERLLTHLPLDEMTAISQRIFSDAFSWTKSFVLWLEFHWSLFLRVQ